jgi:RNA polymerase sigma factor (sigma-70 family)
MNRYSEKEQEQFIKQYDGFIHFMVRKYVGKLRNYDYDDLLQEFRMSFLEACEKYEDDGRAKLSSFAGLVIKNRFIYLKRQEMALKRPDYELVLDDMHNDFDFGGDDMLNAVESMYDDEPTPEEHDYQFRLEQDILSELSKMARGQITIDYFINEMSTQEIADKYRISISLVKHINKLNILKLKNIFKEHLKYYNSIEEQFDLEDFNDTYEKGFFNGK